MYEKDCGFGSNLPMFFWVAHIFHLFTFFFFLRLEKFKIKMQINLQNLYFYIKILHILPLFFNLIIPMLIFVADVCSFQDV